MSSVIGFICYLDFYFLKNIHVLCTIVKFTTQNNTDNNTSVPLKASVSSPTSQTGNVVNIYTRYGSGVILFNYI